MAHHECYSCSTIKSTRPLRMNVLKLLLITLLIYIPSAPASDLRPKNVAKSFYLWVIKNDKGGLPSSSALKAGEPFISTEILRLLRKAKIVERRCVANTPPDLKPLIFEGSLFVDNYEGTTRIISIDWQETDAGIVVSSHLEYKDPRGNAEAVAWPDQLMLIREKGKWVVGDIKGPKRSKSLAAMLEEYTRANCAA